MSGKSWEISLHHALALYCALWAVPLTPAPELKDLERFPSPQWVDRAVKANRAYQEWLIGEMERTPHRRKALEAPLQACWAAEDLYANLQLAQAGDRWLPLEDGSRMWWRQNNRLTGGGEMLFDLGNGVAGDAKAVWFESVEVTKGNCRGALGRLRQALGAGNYARGYLPPSIPPWACEEKD